MRVVRFSAVAIILSASPASAQRYTGADGNLRVALSQQPFVPNGTSPGPKRMATGGIQQYLASQRAQVRIVEAALTPEEDKEYGGWKRSGTR